MDILNKLLKVLNPTNADSGAPAYMNILYAVIAAAALIVTFACKLSLPVPGLDCRQVVSSSTGEPA